MVNKTLRSLFIVNGIFVLGANLFGPLYGLFVERIGGGILHVSFAWALLMASTTVTYFCLSRFPKAVIKPSTLLSLGFLIRALSWLLYSLTTSLYLFFFIQILIGIGEAIGTLGFDVAFAEHLDRRKHVFDYAEWKLVENIILVIATLSGGIIVRFYGFPLLFIIMSGIGILSFGILIIRKPIISS